MGAVRILHCSTNGDNYNICVEQKIAGFGNRTPQKGDLVYLAYKTEGSTICGARFILDKETDERPWLDSERYVVCFNVTNIEFCTPFELKELSSIEPYWGAKYIQGSKTIKEKEVINLLDKLFCANKSDYFDSADGLILDGIEDLIKDKELEEEQKLAECPPDSKSISIMGTFQTINFLGEQDKTMGLEDLVTRNFFNLFPRYQEENSILIAENRLFQTQTGKEKGGVIPDALLIRFNENNKIPFQISLVEFECYADKSSQQKTEYLNRHIIPQLVQFASAFSTMTDELTRKKTIESWINKIINAIDSTEDYQKAIKWLKKIDKNIKDTKFEREFGLKLNDAFEQVVKVVLIIDELSGEQKKTIENIIKSFILPSGSSVMFDAAEVKLIQQITLTGEKSTYALTVK